MIAILNAYGADPARWPQDERAGVQAFLDLHPELMAEVDLRPSWMRFWPCRIRNRVNCCSIASLGDVGTGTAMAESADCRCLALVVGVTVGFAAGMSRPLNRMSRASTPMLMSLGEDWVDWLGEET